jgi:hypothetical protein
LDNYVADFPLTCQGNQSPAHCSKPHSGVRTILRERMRIEGSRILSETSTVGSPDLASQAAPAHEAGFCVSSRFPIALYWGPEFVMVYNDDPSAQTSIRLRSGVLCSKSCLKSA